MAKRVKRAERFEVPSNEPVAPPTLPERPIRLKPLEPIEGTRQGLALTMLEVHDQSILTGPAGSGKTYLAVRRACEFYAANRGSKLVLTRPVVPVGRSIGFFPGTAHEKMAQWAAEMLAIVKMSLGQGVLDTGIANGRIEVIPLETMRSRSFNNAFIVMDEGQNCTPDEATMFWTRLGERAKQVMCGDMDQQDNPGKSGLAYSLDLIGRYQLPVGVVQFEESDIVRSDACARWVRAAAQYRKDTAK